MRKRTCFAIDLREGADVVTEYERLHRPGSVWPEVIADLRANGYVELTIWRTGDRLFMIAEIDPVPSPVKDPAAQIVVDRWEALTSSLQRALPGTGAQPRWIEMECVFDLSEQFPKSMRGS